MDTKRKIADALLRLLDHEALKKISVQQIAKEAKISKQTFYNHFLDKEELIQFIYLQYVIPDFDPTLFPTSFYESYTHSLKRMKRYGSFMKQALLLEGQNTLKEFITKHCETFDLAFHQALYGKELSDTLRLSTIYHANASSAMTFSWILGDFKGSIEELGILVCQMRRMGMEELLKEHDPYQVDD